MRGLLYLPAKPPRPRLSEECAPQVLQITFPSWGLIYCNIAKKKSLQFFFFLSSFFGFYLFDLDGHRQGLGVHVPSPSCSLLSLTKNLFWTSFQDLQVLSLVRQNPPWHKYLMQWGAPMTLCPLQCPPRDAEAAVATSGSRQRNTSAIILFLNLLWAWFLMDGWIFLLLELLNALWLVCINVLCFQLHV